MITEDQNVELIYRWFNQVWNEGRESAIDEMYDEEGVAWGLGDTYIEGPEAFKEFHRLFHTTLSDIRCTVEDVIPKGDKVAMQCTFTMTHTATGKPITLRGGGFARIRNGKIVEAWNAWDFLGMLVQLESLSEDALVRALEGSDQPQEISH